MVKAIINITKHSNQVLNIVKAKWDLKDKSEAINLVTEMFEEDILEPELKPEFIAELKGVSKEKTIKIKDPQEYFRKLSRK